MMVIVKDISVKLNNSVILDKVSYSLPAGKITIFIGKSGAGKTTLLKSLAGLIPFKSGSISLDQKPLVELNLQQRAEYIGYVFQDFNLFPHLTVLQNCMDPLLVRKVPSYTAQEKAHILLKSLEMDPYIHKYPQELSGGQKQRVAIARALCLQPKIILLDEPTASLDPFNSAALTQILKKLAQQELTIGISSQDMDFVRTIYDRIYFLEKGNIIEQCENIDILNNSCCPRIKEFLTIQK